MLPTGLHRLVARVAFFDRKCVSLPPGNQIWQESCFSLPGYWLADRRSLQKEGGPRKGEEGEAGGGEGGGGGRLRRGRGRGRRGMETEGAGRRRERGSRRRIERGGEAE